MKKGIHLGIGLAGLVVFEIALVYRLQPVTTYFYSLVWWSYILLVDGLVYRRIGNSLILNRTGQFFRLIPWSVVIWLIFEGFNLVLKNWYYLGVPKPVFLRWPGYFVAFGTVLPAILETRDLLWAWGIFEKSRIKPIRIGPSWHRPLIVTGILCLVLPLLFPRYFFPLVWMGFVFLLEPFNFLAGRPSIINELNEGKIRTLFQFLLSGMICGLLWEFWNFWAEAKWVYAVPWVGKLKLFEMPVLGFFGFPPFAVESFVLVQFLGLLEPRMRSNKGFVWQTIPLWLFFYGVMFAAIDHYTVRSYGG